MPEYDALTDFDGGGTAVGTINDTRSLLGVHPSMSEKGTFQTLAGSVLMMNLSDIEPFNENGVAKASERSKWGLVNRMGSWVLPADNDSLEERDGMYYITRGGMKGVVAQDGRLLVNPIYDYLDWRADKEQFIARKNGKYGILYHNGKERYPCIFDRIPVESSRGYVEMWQGDTPALYIPDDRLYTVDEYDDILYRSNSYAANPFLPDWMKRHLGNAEPVTLVTDLGIPVVEFYAPYEDPDALYNIMLKSGRPLTEVLSDSFNEDGSLDEELMVVFDEGDMVYAGYHDIEEYHHFSVFDLSGRGRGWTTSACGAYTVRKKESILADTGEWSGGFERSLAPTCFDRAGGSHIPVLRYEYHTWGGRPVVFLGHNILPEEERANGLNEAWRVRITGSGAFLLGDFFHSDDDEYREESFVRIHSAGPDGIAVYEIQQQGISVEDDNWDNPTRGPKKTVACGFIGLTRPFFTQALFEGAHDIEGGMTEVKIDGEWKRVSMTEIQAMDPFVQPAVSDGEARLADEEDAIPFQLVEIKPSFNGGDANEFSKWVNERLIYPAVAKENGVQGRVTTQFTIESDGRLTDIRVLRGVDESLDQEAVRVLSGSPRWSPGIHRGRPVRVTYTFPVIFQLR